MKLSYIPRLVRLLFPSAKERTYASVLKSSVLFDRQFYLDSNPQMHPFYRRLPELHYIQRGEGLGLLPNPDFSPLAYRHHNPDLGDMAPTPLWHYIQKGQAENRQIRDKPIGKLPDGLVLPQIAAFAPKAKFGVVVHLFYSQMWDEIAARLKAQDFPFDLFVTVPEGSDSQAAVLADFPDARVYALPNHGRDMFPFVYLVRSGALDGYKAICKLHTKKSTHRGDGDVWRNTLIDGVLANPVETRLKLTAFLNDQTAGLWVAQGEHLSGTRWWGSNRARTLSLIGRLGISSDGSDLAFPAGSIYWIKPEAVAALKSLDLGYEDFELELSQVDGTTAHALEHGIGYLVAHANQRVVEADELG